jgi:two-component system NtrC family response regulator
VVTVADRVAEGAGTVLITGESGTGKELLARRIHRRSARATGPLVVVNCAAIPAELLESELFGHRKGAFTGATRDARGKFELAHGGTLFLDEVAELPLSLQPRLLRALQESAIDVVGGEEPVPVDVRVIAATNRDLAKLVDEGKFRLDLFYRLNVIVLHIPPLRERSEDIAPLARHFLTTYGGGRPFDLGDEALRRMRQYRWPGNIRELENICQRVTLLADGGVVPLELIPETAPEAEGMVVSAAGRVHLPPDGISLMELEKEVIVQALERSGGNKAQAARLLRIPRHILLYRLEQHGIGGKGNDEKS